MHPKETNTNKVLFPDLRIQKSKCSIPRWATSVDLLGMPIKRQENGKVQIEPIVTSKQKADYFTKGVGQRALRIQPEGQPRMVDIVVAPRVNHLMRGTVEVGLLRD